MKKHKRAFNFGDWVESIAYVEFGYTDNLEEPIKRVLFRRRLKIVGRIAGMVYRYEGIVEKEKPFVHSYFSPDEDPPQTYLHTLKSHKLYLIKQGMINKPYMCLPTDMGRVDARYFPKLWQTPWRPEHRNALREEMKNHPRDKKGRWIKQ